MSAMLPAARPEMGRHAAEQLLHERGVDLTRPALLGRRAYYRDSMGVKGENDWGIYDDAIMLVTPTAYVTFNANCDASKHHPGVAQLKVGVWRYKVGTHGLSRPKAQQYEALVQAAKVTVVRDPDDHHTERWEDTDWLGINIHRGSYSTTSSEGCQTIYPDQWESFLALVKSELQRYHVVELPYCLTER